MAVMNTSQQAGNSVYLLTTARILMVLGLVYLARSLYQFAYTRARGSLRRAYRAGEPQVPREATGNERIEFNYDGGYVAGRSTAS